MESILKLMQMKNDHDFQKLKFTKDELKKLN